MPTIVRGDKSGGLIFHNPDGGAKVGRWCAPPQAPDRCARCFDLKTLAHHQAEFYFEEKAKETAWRYGACHRCAPRLKQEGKKLKKV